MQEKVQRYLNLRYCRIVCPEKQERNSYNYYNDTEFTLCSLIDDYFNASERSDQELFLIDSDESNTSFFHGESGLITRNGISKALLYGYYFLSKMGDRIIERGNNYIVTNSSKGTQVLLYNYDEKCNEIKKQKKNCFKLYHPIAHSC